MINKIDKNSVRQVRHKRVRNKVVGSSVKPRLCVYRSLSQIYAQIIDDEKGVTLASASTLEKPTSGRRLRLLEQRLLKERLRRISAKLCSIEVAIST